MNLIELLAAGVKGAENGHVEVYTRGTSTPARVYSDFVGTVHPQSGGQIDLDGNGGVVLYANELVDVLVYDSDGTEFRNVVAGIASPSVEVISNAFTGTDYVSRASGASKPTQLATVLSRAYESFGAVDWNVLVHRLGAETSISLKNAIGNVDGLFFNVMAPEYGAAGGFGTADDTTPIQNAINAAQAAGGGTVVFPPGAYRITSKLTVPALVNLLGFGPGITAIKIDSATDPVLEYSVNATIYGFQRIEGMRLWTMQASSAALVSVTATSKQKIRMIDVHTDISGNHTGNCVTVNASATCTLMIERCDFTTNGAASCCVSAIGTAVTVIAQDSYFHNSAAAYSGQLFSTRNGSLFGCRLSLSAMTSGTAVAVLHTGTGGAGPTGVMVGNSAVAPTSGSAAVYQMSSGNEATTYLMESDTMLSGTWTAFTSGWNAQSNRPQLQTTTRDSLTYTVPHTGTGALDVKADQFGVTIIQINDNNNFTIQCSQPPEGAEWTLIAYNNAGGASGTVTYGTGFRAGLATFTALTNQKYEVRHFRQISSPTGREMVPVSATQHDV